MKTLRKKEIIEYCKDWKKVFPEMSIKDCFFALYKDRIITDKELESMIDWLTPSNYIEFNKTIK
jgi:hypothetical protein